MALVQEYEIPSSVPAAKLFKVYLVESHVFAPKILSDAIKNIQILQGDGGVGSIKKTNFAEGFPVKYLVNKVDFIDEVNFEYNYTTTEGEPWLDTIEKVTYVNKIVTSADGGSIFKIKSTFHPKGDATIDLEKIKPAEENIKTMFKAVEAYILANPDV